MSARIRSATRSAPGRLRFRLNPLIRRWLRAAPPPGCARDAEDESAEADPEGWDGWAIRQLARGRLLEVGGVWVDRQILEQRFACVPERCSPGLRGREARSCCADAAMLLSAAEAGRIARGLRADSRTGAGRASSSSDRRPERSERDAWLDRGNGALLRPGGRCVFAMPDAHGRLRCSLRQLEQRRGLSRNAVQPIGCRLFPLIVVDLGAGRTLLSVVSKSTHRIVRDHPPRRFPCLCDAALPPLVESMRTDLDWLFGCGFARALAKSAAAARRRDA